MSSPAYPAGYAPHQSPPGQPTTPGGLPRVTVHTVLVALRCWWHIALPIGLLLGAGAATVVYYTTSPTYSATAWLFISQRSTNPMPGTTGDDSQRFVANQRELMRSPPVLEPVISLPAVRSAPELRKEIDPYLYLRNRLQVKSLGSSDYFELGYTSEDPVKAALIVNEVVHSYMQLYTSHDSKVMQKTIEYLDDLSKEQYEEVKRLRGRVDELYKEVTGEEALPAQVSSEKSAVDSLQQQLELELLRAEVDLIAVEAELKAEKNLFSREEFTPPVDLVSLRVLADPELAQMKAELTVMQEKRDEHKKVSKNPDANTALKQVETAIVAAEAKIARFTQEHSDAVKAELERTARAKRTGQIAQLEFQQAKLAETVEYLKTKTQTKKVEKIKAAGKVLELEFARGDLLRASTRYDALATRIQQLRAEQRAPERVSLFQSATVPTRPDEEIPLKKMLMAALAALVIPFGLAVGIEVLFGRVASRQQLEHTGQIAVVGEITNLPRRLRGPAQDGAPRRDVQLFEESINGLRTYLTLIEASRGRRVLAVTSSISREGKTSLAAQLAMSVANSTGQPTLLIDGDMRSPDIHCIFGVDVGPGLAEVLSGKIPVEEAIETEVSSRLHLLTAGRMSASPHQLTGSGGFAATVEKLRGLYDNIIIDTPPILAASEALLMAGAADAAILCVRRDYSRVDQVNASVQRLAASGVKVAGAVLNGVPTQHYAYRYGSYYYTKERIEDADTPEEIESPAAG